MAEVRVPLGDALEMIIAACGLPEGATTALEARFRQLDRMGVPRGRRDRRHARYSYGLTELAELAVAIELMKAYVPPLIAARYVVERWEQFAPCALAGIGDEPPSAFRDRRPDRAGPRAFIAGGALSDLGRRKVRQGRSESPLANVLADPDGAAAPAGSGIVIDAAVFMPEIYRRLRAIPTVRTDDLMESLERLRQSELRVPAERPSGVE